jgi:ferric-dicitrate binding protein FerR (iron transport regulator)
MTLRNRYKKTSIVAFRRDLSSDVIVTSTAEAEASRYFQWILLAVLVTILPFALYAQHSINLTTMFPKTKKDTLTFRDSSWCEMDAGTICKYAGAGWRSLLLSGRAVVHVAPRPSKFEINLYPHKLVVAPYETADIYVYARNFCLISACVLSGKVTWIHKTRESPLAKRAGIYLQGSDYRLDMTNYVYRDYQNWSRGLYLYDDINLQDFASELSQKYGVRIDLDDPALKEHRIRIGIEARTSLLTALNHLCLISQLSFRVDENNTIKLKSKQDDN